MNWEHESYRRLFTREEGSFAALPFFARALAAMLLKLADQDGRIHASPGKDIGDTICFRFGASRGERRQIRTALDQLLSDGYLVTEERAVRIRNFVRANESKLERERRRQEQRAAVREHASTVSRPCIDGASTEARPGIEEECKASESLNSGGGVPSVPSFLPLEENKKEENTHTLEARPADRSSARVSGQLDLLGAPEPAKPASRVKRRKADRQESPAFAAAYEAYPRHVGREKAWDAWQEACLRVGGEEKLAELVRAADPATHFRETPWDKIPYLATWLNASRWTDERPRPQQATTSKQPRDPRIGRADPAPRGSYGTGWDD